MCPPLTMESLKKLSFPIDCYCGAKDVMYSPDNVFIFFILSFGLFPSSVHDRGIDVCRRGSIGLVEQRDHTEKYSPVSSDCMIYQRNKRHEFGER
jgi:hypothetical protein